MTSQELKIRKCKLKMFTNDLIFFGMMANKFKWVIKDCPESIEGYITFDANNLNTIESGEIVINKFYTEKENHTFEHLAFIICHELLHILHKHGLRQGDRNPMIWNVAGDHIIERFLKTLSNVFKPFNNEYNIVEQLHSENSKCTIEQAYNWLISQQNNKVEITGDDDTIHVKEPNRNNEFDVNANMPGQKSSPEEQTALDQFMAESRAMFENLKEKGSLSGSIVEYLDDILKVEIPWEKLVEKSIKTNIIMKPDDRSWRVLNKFYMPHKLTLPGITLTEDLEGTGQLIVCVDSSGSINNTNLKKFSGVIENSMKHFKEIHVLIHDVHIQQKKIFSKDNIYSFYDFIKNEGYKGRGGTSHTYVFNEIENEFWNKNKDNLSMVICLTDGYSNIECIISNYNWIKNNIPLTLIITKDGNIPNLSNKLGAILSIQMN